MQSRGSHCMPREMHSFLPDWSLQRHWQLLRSKYCSMEQSDSWTGQPQEHDMSSSTTTVPHSMSF